MRLAQVGDVFSSRYQLLDVLGSGGFATVFRGRDQTIGRDVVVKVLTPTGGRYTPSVRARFLREARIFGELQSPYIVTMYDFGESAEGLLFMVFEYVAGVELGELTMNGGLPPDVVANLLQQLLSALDESHRKGVLHRDIKPANILVYQYADDPHRVKLLDYGVAKDFTGSAKTLTSAGAVVGTLRYMSPEQLAGETLGPPTDIYSLGLVAYEMLVGQPAIRGDSQREMILAQIDDNDITVPAQLAPAGLRFAIDAMLRKELSARPHTARDVMQLLQQSPLSGPHAASNNTPRPHASSSPLRPVRASSSSSELRGVDTVGTTVKKVPGASDTRSAWRRWRPFIVAGAIVLLTAAAFIYTRSTDHVVRTPVATESRSALFGEDEPTSPTAVGAPTKTADATAPNPDATSDGDAPRELGVKTPRCGVEPPFSGVGALPSTIGSVAYFPTSYGEKPQPLVVLFHRAFRTASEFIDYSKFTELAEKHGFVVVAFEGTEQLGWTDRRFAEVAHNIEQFYQDHCLDRSRLHLVGDDHGSRITWTLPCMIPVTSYLVTFDRSARTCVPILPTSRLRVYGLHDRFAPPDGSPGCSPLDGDTASAASFRRSWKEALSCGESEPWGNFKSGTCERFDCEHGNHAICKGELNHQWPDGPSSMLPWPGCDADLYGELFPISDAAWAYFTDEGVPFTEEQLASHVGEVLPLPY